MCDHVRNHCWVIWGALPEVTCQQLGLLLRPISSQLSQLSAPSVSHNFAYPKSGCIPHPFGQQTIDTTLEQENDHASKNQSSNIHWQIPMEKKTTTTCSLKKQVVWWSYGYFMDVFDLKKPSIKRSASLLRRWRKRWWPKWRRRQPTWRLGFQNDGIGGFQREKRCVYIT